jgi:hypothetical protein
MCQPLEGGGSMYSHEGSMYSQEGSMYSQEYLQSLMQLIVHFLVVRRHLLLVLLPRFGCLLALCALVLLTLLLHLDLGECKGMCKHKHASITTITITIITTTITIAITIITITSIITIITFFRPYQWPNRWARLPLLSFSS